MVELLIYSENTVTTVEIYHKGSAPTSAHTVDFNRGLCISAQEALGANIFFNLLIWCLKEL